jgi:hypothetical protein
MITTLSFTVHGHKSKVEAAAKEFMERMGTIMGKRIKGTTLVELHRNDEKLTLKQIKKRQIDSMFKINCINCNQLFKASSNEDTCPKCIESFGGNPEKSSEL